jgi:hypothetical protein
VVQEVKLIHQVNKVVQVAAEELAILQDKEDKEIHPQQFHRKEQTVEMEVLLPHLSQMEQELVEAAADSRVKVVQMAVLELAATLEMELKIQ